MRWFSRLGSWLRATAPTEPVDQGEQQELFSAFVAPGPSPATAPERFRAALLRAVDTSVQHDRAAVYRLDPTVQVLIIPPGLRSADTREDRLTEDIDRAILDLSSDGRPLASLTWSALKDARPAFDPTYLEWSADQPDRFDGSVGLVFFLDLEAIAQAAAQAAQALGFSTRYEPERPAVIIHDGRFEAHVGVNALIAESIWTARGPLATVQKRARALPSEFRTFLAVTGGLKRRYPEAQIRTEGSFLEARLGEERHEIDYRHVAASVRSAGLSVDTFLARAVLEDLTTGGGEPGLAVRSPSVLTAWPDALAEKEDGYLVVAVRQDEDGRQALVRRTDDDPPGRFEHYAAEARRQIGFTRFAVHAAVVEDRRHEAVIAIGDRVAGVCVDGRLVRGLLDALVVVPPKVRLLAVHEDALLLIPDGASEDLVAMAKERLAYLEEDLLPDGADPLEIDMELELPGLSAGTFELHVIDDVYFAYRLQAESATGLQRSRRSLLRGLALRVLGKTEGAVGWLEQAFRADRDDGEVALVLGQAHFALDDCSAALPFLERASDLLPDSAEAANALGLAAWGMGQTAEANAAFEQAVRLEPTETTFLVNLGRSYVDAFQFSKARVCLERALRLEPDSAEAHASMALLCHRTDDPGGARRHAREALAEQPDDQTLRRLLEALDEDPD